jgi:GT2 family glycosyltransferase
MDNLLIVVVIYEIPLIESSTLLSLNNQRLNLNVLVYDNSKTNDNIDYVSRFPFLDIVFFHNGTNAGVSSAYNYGLNKCIENKIDYLLLLDQDSDLPIGIIEKYFIALKKFPQVHLFVPTLKYQNKIISPGRSLLYRSFARNRKLKEGSHSLSFKSILNSGMFIKSNYLKELNGFNEKLPLDFSDTYLVDKFKARKSKVVIIDAIVEHSLSSFDTNFQKVLTRYQSYCKSAKEYGRGFKFIFVFFWLLMRTIKLCVKFKTFKFISIFLKKS